MSAKGSLCERAVSKSVHGGRLADKQTIQNWVADSSAAIEAYRLLTLRAAWTIDREGAAVSEAAARARTDQGRHHSGNGRQPTHAWRATRNGQTG